MKILYVGHILPMEVSKALKTSVAGNKFECSFVKALDTELKGNVDVVSFAYSGYSEIKSNNIREVYAGKPFVNIVPTTKPILGDLVKNTIFFFVALKWILTNFSHDKAILIINSPFGISVLSLVAKLFGAKIVSFTIDTPFTPSNKFAGFFGWYAITCFSLGHRILQQFSGIIVLNNAAVTKLRLRIPYLVTKIGFDEELYDVESGAHKSTISSHPPFNIVYAGTLIDYNGVVTLAKAFELLDKKKYVLNIYGSGPLEHVIKQYSQVNNNIIFRGMIDNKEMLKVFSKADLLINPRVTTAAVCDFTFPSKLTEYILSGHPVLTTNFSSLPEEYKRFVFLIEDESPEGFCKAIERVFCEEESKLFEMCNEGMKYIRQHQSWKVLSKDVCAFIESLWADRRRGE